MTADAWITLVMVLIPAVGGITAVATVYTRSWRRRWWLRKLDRMFEDDRDWWEEQFRDDLGRK